MGAALAQERDPRAAARSRAPADPLHAVLGRRPPRRAAGHVRGPAVPRGSRTWRPKVVETDEGHEVWEFDGKIYFQVGLNAVVGRPSEDWQVEPTRFDEMRPGCFDIDARVRDMDINGVWASVNFPSQITGFCGSVFSRCSDPELGLAVTQRVERLVLRGVVLAAPRPHRPDGHHLPRRRRAGRRGDPAQRGARLHRGDAARAAAPHRDGADLLGLVGSDHRRVRGDRHRRSACTSVRPASPTCPRARRWCRSARRCSASSSLDVVRGVAVVGCCVRHPDLKIIMSEGGIGWVAMLHDRLENIVDRSGYGHYFAPATSARPRCCTATSGSARSTTRRRSRTLPTVGVDHIMFETDYPHGDGTWPDSQQVFARRVRRAARRRDRQDQPRERGRASSATRCPRPAPPTPSASAPLTLPRSGAIGRSGDESHRKEAVSRGGRP